MWKFKEHTFLIIIGAQTFSGMANKKGQGITPTIISYMST